MRRRDATDDSLHHTHHTGWPAAVSVAFSLGVHAALLAAATIAVLPGSAATELIRVSLASRGGSGARAGPGPAEQTAAAASPPPVAAPEPLRQTPPLPPAPRRHARWHATHHQPQTTLAENAERLSGNTAAADAASVVAGSDAEAHVPGTGAAGAGSGSGLASGLGAGDRGDQRVDCVYCPEPRYPLIARARGWQGTVDVGLLVLADGSVDAASLRRSSGYGVLDRAAITVARQSRFRPPAASGLPAPLRGRIEYRFQLTTSR